MAVTVQGPRPSAFYTERMAFTRSPATPTQAPVSGDITSFKRTSNFAAGQIDPGVGNATPGDGLVLAGLYAVTVSVWAGTPNGVSLFTGTANASMLCWVYNPFIGQWSRASDLDLDMSTPTTFPGKTFGTFHNVSRLGYLINWLSSGVVADSADMLLRIDGFQSASGSST